MNRIHFKLDWSSWSNLEPLDQGVSIRSSLKLKIEVVMQNPVHDTPSMVYVCGKLAGFIKLLKPKLLHNSNV